LPSFLFVLLAFLLVAPALARPAALVVEKGDLPLLIVAGHGGHFPLEGAEQRLKEKVDDPHFVLFGDTHTNDLASDLAGAVGQEVGGGHRPSLILNEIHRRFCDVNRSPRLSSQDPVGVAHHTAFHQAIDDELARLVALHGWALLLDIHGQAHYDTTLLLGTAENSAIGPWSRQALWGHGGLVESLKSAGFTVAPESPDGQQRYGGGYTVRHHGADPRVEAWQMEHSRALRNDQLLRSRYLKVVAQALAGALHHPPFTASKG
jgi:N-formylglutamate amidohydrolase